MHLPARLLTVALPALALGFASVPANAGPAENAFLQKFVGTYAGTGAMTGAQSSPIACRLQVKPSTNRLSYTGRCNVQDLGAQSFTGSITYDDQSKQYVSRTSQGNAVGVKKGNNLTFTGRGKNIRGTVDSTLTLSPTTITVDFTFYDSKTKGTSKSHVVLRK